MQYQFYVCVWYLEAGVFEKKSNCGTQPNTPMQEPFPRLLCRPSWPDRSSAFTGPLACKPLDGLVPSLTLAFPRRL